MAIPVTPFWASAAKKEAEKGYSDIESAAYIRWAFGLPSKGKLSELAGKQFTVTQSMDGGEHRQGPTMTGFLAGVKYVLNIPANAKYYSPSTDYAACTIDNPNGADITVNIAAGARIWGCGGQGGKFGDDILTQVYSGEQGGIGLWLHGNNITLHNSGDVKGGGGGGGPSVAARPSGNHPQVRIGSTGGGGQPFGLAGTANVSKFTEFAAGTAGTETAPGVGGRRLAAGPIWEVAGAGGAPGAAGSKGSVSTADDSSFLAATGGAAGTAIYRGA